MIKNNMKYYFIFTSILFIICFTTGFIYQNNVIDVNEFKDSFLNSLNLISIDNFLFELSILTLIMFLSPILVGFVGNIFYFSYQAFISGFIVSSFYSIYNFKGLLAGTIFIISSKIILLIILFLMGIYTFNIFKLCINKILYKKNYTINYFNKYVKRYIIIIIIYLICNIILYFTDKHIINLLDKII